MATSTTVQTINNDKLLKLGERFLNDYEKQKTRSLMYYKKMKNDPVFFQRRREQKQLFYQNNKDKINQNRSNSYKTDDEYERKKQADRTYYSEKTAFNVKNKRGRKPKVNNINEVETTEIIEKPRRGRGRPKKQNIITK